ncbi:hypothetical protein S7711_01733 [Stachybotrys chartarum IBT 7711]|uniref:Peroxidase n=1 Tax=Stachybotrys chartarum (strain CBS 109288 / IBT 7711) TaxID=1280523 RepID=A0A084AVF3_STACB|nr:hypothetical protein S7711_01733 [Stachybotrys chartarum IBT 7711]
MKAFVLAAVIATLGPAATTFGSYAWPSSYDEIEDIYSLRQGYEARLLGDKVASCGVDGGAESQAPDWLRVAFHDMITHDAAAGTGGLEALPFPQSVRCRPLGLGVVAAHSACGGITNIPYRFGHIDAQSAGAAGVPQKHDPVTKMADRFAAAGFNQADMIALTACGHSLGGQHGPDHNHGLVEDDEEAEHDETAEEEEDEEPHDEEEEHGEELENFDTTPNGFDNLLAIEYLDGTSKSPLIVGENATTNSDARLFASDGNVTMVAVAASQATFESRCCKFFARMIDSVPSSVRLSDPLEVIDIKPYITGLYLNAASDIVFAGRIRVLTTEGPSVGRDPNDLAVRLARTSRLDVWSSDLIDTTCVGDAYGPFGEIFAWYEFETFIEDGITRFNIHLAVPSTGEKTVYDNGGLDYPVEYKLLYQTAESCVAWEAVDGARVMTAVVSVHNEFALLPLKMDLVRHERRQGSIKRTLVKVVISFTRTTEERGD